jgi:hypothetical protein
MTATPVLLRCLGHPSGVKDPGADQGRDDDQDHERGSHRGLETHGAELRAQGSDASALVARGGDVGAIRSGIGPAGADEGEAPRRRAQFVKHGERAEAEEHRADGAEHQAGPRRVGAAEGCGDGEDVTESTENEDPRGPRSIGVDDPRPVGPRRRDDVARGQRGQESLHAGRGQAPPDDRRSLRPLVPDGDRRA